LRIRVDKLENGESNIIVYKTRLHENPTTEARNVKPEDYEDTMARLVNQVANEAP
jgi:hypothetical protein